MAFELPSHPALDDRAGLDAQYNNREMVPNHVELYEGWVPVSAQVFGNYPSHKEIAYGSSPRETIDIILPKGDGPHPVMIYIHGGYWMSREKSDQTFIAPAFADNGIAFALVEYDLMPNVGMGDIISQCRNAAQFIHQHADEYNLDASRMFVSGHSAGGHLTVMLASTDWSALGGPADILKGGCALSGIYDLNPIRHNYLQDIIGLTESDVTNFSPQFFTDAASVPLIISAGGGESDAFRHQSRALVNAWTAKGADCTYLEPTGLNHFTILSEFADPNSELTKAAINMINGGR